MKKVKEVCIECEKYEKEIFEMHIQEKGYIEKCFIKAKKHKE